MQFVSNNKLNGYITNINRLVNINTFIKISKKHPMIIMPNGVKQVRKPLKITMMNG